MFRLSAVRFPKKFCDEVEHLHRRIGPWPRWNPREGVEEEWKERFLETGGYFDRVWVTLSPGSSRKRYARRKDKNEMTYYYRPMTQRKQAKYMRRLRVRGHSNHYVRAMNLEETNYDIGFKTGMPEDAKLGMFERYGAHLAPPRPKDFEYRVF
jgi:hypothetical protein